MRQLTLRQVRAVLLALALAAAATGSGSAASESKLRALAFPSLSAAPGLVRISATVHPEHENRVIEFVADSGTYYRRSAITLEGERAPRLHVVHFRDIPAGTYDIRVSLLDVDGRTRAAVNQRILVIE